MKWLADLINEFGRRCQSAGKLAMADRSYRLACWLAPRWGAPHFN